MERPGNRRHKAALDDDGEPDDDDALWGELRTMALVPAYTDKASLRGSSARIMRGGALCQPGQ